MFDYLNSLTWKRLSIYLAAFFTLVLLVGGQLFIAFGYAHQDVKWIDGLWPPFLVGFLVLIGCSIMPYSASDITDKK